VPREVVHRAPRASAGSPRAAAPDRAP
jgi:hypothetical protein